MRTQPRYKLSGKARRVHHRNRAARLNARQQMAEAFDGEFEPAVLRLKPPILARPSSEFLPSADPTFDPIGAATHTQLELPFNRPDHRDNHPPCSPSRTDERVEEATGVAPVTMSTKSDRNSLNAADDVPNGFTLGGLLYGCLIGSATAALILVCLRALFP